ncbi:hypothetical protein HJC23_008201 [Cyclotella cryptica]|uniref:cGMP-dependent protein kinase n=1 Tax=Cyclotella cryptica TaxID=29204 RepID=A0ABD3PET1_9STRA
MGCTSSRPAVNNSAAAVTVDAKPAATATAANDGKVNAKTDAAARKEDAAGKEVATVKFAVKNGQVQDPPEDPEDEEPKMYIGLGTRRESTTEIEVQQGIARRASSKGAKILLPEGVDNTAIGSSMSGNFMQNIHSSPVAATLTYTPPKFDKSDADGEFISIALQRNFIFANALSDEAEARNRELKLVVDAFEPFEVATSGLTILSANSVGDYFYILKEGSVDYMTADPRTKTRTVTRTAKRPGQSFGELCLLYDCPPPADCVSGPNTPVKLWRLNKTTFRQIMALTSMKKDETLRNALKTVKHLELLDGEFINRIADALDVKEVPKGAVLYKEGDAIGEFYVIGSEGKVEVTRVHGKSVVLGPGEAFGEEALVPKNIPAPQTRMETVKALEKTTVFTTTADQLNRVIGSLDDAIQLSQDRRLLKSVPVFRDSDFEPFEYELLAALIEKVTFKGGKEVVLEDELVEAPALYIVYDGILEMECEKYPERERALRKGDFFGEASLLPDKNSKFGGKGGSKYHEESVIVLSDIVVCGKLTLANIDSVILDLHRLGCNRPGQKKYSGPKRLNSISDNEPPPQSLDELKYHHLFGAGTFGRVWCVTRVGGKIAYALKIQSKRELLDQRQASSAVRERGVMAKLDHPFVCKLVASFQDDACIYMLLTLIQGGELLNLIQGGETYGGLPESAAKFYAAGIAEGLTYMHRRHIVYRDLKPENVLLDKDGYAVIVDLGFAKSVSDKTYTFCGTPLYLAPEIVLSKGHDRAVDYWSLGCLIYEMLFGTTPFYEKGIDQKGLFRNIVRGKWEIPRKYKLSKNASNLISGMLQRKPTERLGCLAGGYRDIKNHPWMQEVNFVKLVQKQIKAPWTPKIDDPLDISNFESFDDDGGFGKGKKPLTTEEQLVFQDF